MIKILVLVLAFHYVTSLMSVNEFQEKIIPVCFDNGLPLKPQSGLTLENFIYLLEKYEKKHPERNMETNIMLFLKEFSCGGLKYPLSHTSEKFYYGEKEIYALNRKKILDSFLKEELERIPALEDDDFTKEEICNLFFSLSHTVYRGVIKPKPERKYEENNTNISRLTTEMPIIPDNQNQQEQTTAILEDGVVNFGDDKARAISLSDVLLGILGATVNKQKKLKELLGSDSRPEYDEKVFKSSFTFSLSALIADSEIYLSTNGIFQPSIGKWTSSGCSNEYVLTENTKMFTYATLVGSLDGFIMGEKILEDNRRPKLSQLLRMYYSQHGFSLLPPKSLVSFCERGAKQEDGNFKLELTNQTNNYILYYFLKSGGHTPNITDSKVNNAISMFYNIMPRASERLDVETTKCAKPDKEVCETPSNVVIVLDERNHYDTQIYTAMKLINDNGLEEKTFSVFTNFAENMKTDMKKLADTIDKDKISASCILHDSTSDASSLLDEGSVLEAINRTLMEIEQKSISFPGVPSKVVIYYNYGLNVADNVQLKKKIENARRELLSKHRGAAILAVGENKENLKKLVPELNIIDSRSNELYKKLEEKICLAPAEFQYSECKKRSKLDSEFLLHVNPNGVQYWQMQPKYFYKSFGYKLKFKPENGNIKVCFRRDDLFSKSDTGCEQTNDNKREIEFSRRDPCKGYNAITCRPFYFSISGLDDSFLTECTTQYDEQSDDKPKPICKSLNQIKVSFNHEGLACNDALRQIGSIYHYLIAIFAAFYIINRKS